ncbi:ABC transporter substrate-binding protein [Rhizobium sp. SL86]|uniref:ABC transporter substrate-binding protein n=1 Tax=Rhizobium sp. SL86 TaxID=2995148 RepID=UPI002275AE29|nr:ABC transporter substrate-binding protein [Rhizobium sp. SL86]MCY1666707.1 ABC transporter substrate-binding protein [Rhizobium sp. SL86]
MTTRRQFCASVAATGLMAGIAPAALTGKPLTIIDMAGREVRLPGRPKRIVLLEGHDLLTMSLLHPDPASLIIGWAAVDRIDSASLQTGLLKGHKVPVVGKLTPDTLSLEALIGLMPDLVVTTAFMTPQADMDSLVDRLIAADIPVIYSDASSNAAGAEPTSDPVSTLKASMRMWGQLLDASEKAEAYIAFFQQALSDIGRRLAGAKPVTIYLEVQSTLDDCCWAAGRKIWGELLSLAGGQPLPGVTAPWFEKLSPEYLIATPHDVYIATGGGWASGGRPSIGPGIDPNLSRASLQRLVDGRPSFAHLPSVRNGRVHGIWTGLITNLPLNILFVAQAARWLHPDRSADLDPAALLETINRDFAAVRIEAPLWASI